MTIAALIVALTAALPLLSAKDQEFAKSLLLSANGSRGASEKQVKWMEILINRANGTAPVAETVSVDGIISLLRTASKSLKFPKVRLSTDSGQRVVLSLAGPKSRYTGDVMVTDGGPFGANVYFGRITQDGAVVASGSMDAPVLSLLQAFAADPAGVGALIGRRFGSCCFCSRDLETRESLAVGYGPVCAVKYELPWG
jgi:hypothetical protein